MYHYRKVCGYILKEDLSKGLLDTYDPPIGKSAIWKHWAASIDLKTCFICASNHGKIYSMNTVVIPEPPVHPNCRCKIEPIGSVSVGFGTKDAINGADWWIVNRGVLPDYYVTREEAENLGWKPGKSPKRYAPGKMIAGGAYRNDDGHLPDAPGRVWYEADINYYEGRRNMHRLVWSNDGLVFVTYDHYLTFHEITNAAPSGAGRKTYDNNDEIIGRVCLDLSPYLI